MREYLSWLKDLNGKPIFVAYPVAFDYAFISWYLHEFVGEDPFWFATVDIQSYAMATLRKLWTESRCEHMPQELFDPDCPHTHKAIDDAMEHVMLFCSMAAANHAP